MLWHLNVNPVPCGHVAVAGPVSPRGSAGPCRWGRGAENLCASREGERSSGFLRDVVGPLSFISRRIQSLEAGRRASAGQSGACCQVYLRISPAAAKVLAMEGGGERMAGRAVCRQRRDPAVSTRSCALQALAWVIVFAL